MPGISAFMEMPGKLFYACADSLMLLLSLRYSRANKIAVVMIASISATGKVKYMVSSAVKEGSSVGSHDGKISSKGKRYSN
jgi:hypothetical protein